MNAISRPACRVPSVPAFRTFDKLSADLAAVPAPEAAANLPPGEMTLAFGILRDSYDEALQADNAAAWRIAEESAEFFSRLCARRRLECQADEAGVVRQD